MKIVIFKRRWHEMNIWDERQVKTMVKLYGLLVKYGSNGKGHPDSK